MQVVVTTAPGTLPFALATAIRAMRALEDDADLVELYCRAAVQTVEDYTGRAMLQTIYTAQLDSWPTFGRGLGINGPFERANLVVDAIPLPRSPLVAIGSVKYYPDGGGAQATLLAANYYTDIRSLPGRLVFIDTVDLPALAARQDAVEIVFTAGEGTKESDVSPMMLVTVLKLARHFLDYPGCVDEMGNVRKMPYSFQSLLRQLKI